MELSVTVIKGPAQVFQRVQISAHAARSDVSSNFSKRE